MKKTINKDAGHVIKAGSQKRNKQSDTVTRQSSDRYCNRKTSDPNIRCPSKIDNNALFRRNVENNQQI